MYQFGSGVLYGTQLQDATGAAIANPTPVVIGALQDISVDIAFDTKMLYGQNQFPISVGRGKGKISGKAKLGDIDTATYNNLFFGQVATAGLIGVVNEVTGALIPTTPFQITITPPSSGVFSQDLGVLNASGVPMTRVAAGPTTGQYSVNTGTGVYTFAAADVGLRVFISFQYTATVTGAQKVAAVNQLMGYAPTFRVDLNEIFNGKQFTLTLFSCLASKLTHATKLDDYMIAEMDFDAFADSIGRVYTWSMSE